MSDGGCSFMPVYCSVIKVFILTFLSFNPAVLLTLSLVMSEIKPYSGADDKRTQVERMFDGIAPSYDLLNHLLSFGVDKGWRRKAISLLADSHPREVLDVATGTADMAIALHRSLGANVVGCDISPKMVEVGVKKVESAGLASSITLRVADSEALPFSSNRFDAITVAFGVRNFANLDKGLSQMCRVLKPGGRLVVLEFSTPPNAIFRGLYNFYFRNILPLIGGAISHDREAYGYLCRSAMAFPSGEDFERHLYAAGLKPVSSTMLTFGIATAYLATKP